MNYNEDTDSENDITFNSVASNLSTPTTPLSPSHPQYILQASPAPTNQVLNDVASNLRVVEAVQNVVPNWPAFGEEETLEGNIVETVENLKVDAEDIPEPETAAIMTNFEDENGTDTDKAMQDACRALERLEWDDCDVLFFFAKAERKMKAAGVKKQFTKFQCLGEAIPKKVSNEV